MGCCFHPSIVCSAFFSVNPDRRRRIYNTPTGIYREGCGLAAVHMSWSASEYLYMVRGPPTSPPICQPACLFCSFCRDHHKTIACIWACLVIDMQDLQTYCPAVV